MSSLAAPPDFDIYSDEFERDRYAIYAQLREEFPMYWHEQTGSWIVTRYDDVAKWLVGEDFITSPLITNIMSGVAHSDVGKFGDIINVIRTWMIYNDRPVHTRARKHMSRAFWTSELEQIRPEIKKIVNAQLDRTDLSSDTFDFVSSIAHPIPALVLCQMLGIEGSDVDLFIGWSDDLAAFMQDFVVSPVPNVAISEKTSASIVEIHEYLTASIATRRARPRNDLLTRLISSEPSEDGELFDAELITQVIHLIFGGHKIPQFLLSNAFNLLFQHPAELDATIADPSRAVRVVDETMRVEGPIQYITRHAAHDMTLHGEHVKADDSVYFMIGAAGRDDSVFVDGAAFRPGRSGPRSLGFGGGYHACIAGSFARMEVDEIIRSVLERIPTLSPRYDVSNPLWTRNPTFHGILQMPVSV